MGSHEQAELVAMSLGPKQPCHPPGCSPGGHRPPEQGGTSGQLELPLSVAGVEGLGLTRISIYTVLELMWVDLSEVWWAPSLDVLLTALLSLSRNVKSSLLRV